MKRLRYEVFCTRQSIPRSVAVDFMEKYYPAGSIEQYGKRGMITSKLNIARRMRKELIKLCGRGNVYIIKRYESGEYEDIR